MTAASTSGNCGIVASRIGFQHRDYSGSKEQVNGKGKMKEVVEETIGLELTNAFAHAEEYRNWETNEVLL